MSTGSDTLAVPVGGERWRLRRPRLQVWLPLLVLALIVAAGAGADLFAPYSPAQAHLPAALTPPQWHNRDYILGTDRLGRDVLSRLLYGTRTSLEVGVGAVLLSAAIGIPLGLLAGYAGSLVEWAIIRMVDVQMSIPGILLLVVLAYIIGPGLLTTVVILGVAGWVQYARMARAETKVVTSQPYVLAAQATGAGPLRVAVRHALPNIVGSLLVLATLQFGQAVILEASISFLGFGVQPPGSSLGIMVADGRALISVAWWLLLFPSVMIFAIVLCINLAGDVLHGWLDPLQRRR